MKDRIALNVTWEQFRESIFAGWTNCEPSYHIDAVEAWKHLLGGGNPVAGNYDDYATDRKIWDDVWDDETSSSLEP
jgi:hypothetical protein